MSGRAREARELGRGRQNAVRARDRRAPCDRSDGWNVRREDGQAAVETVAIAPLVAVLITALVVAFHAYRAGEEADVAVHAAGVAALVGRDPVAAARAAAPEVAAKRLTIERRGSRITVRVRATGPRTLVRSFDAERTVALPSGAGR